MEILAASEHSGSNKDDLDLMCLSELIYLITHIIGETVNIKLIGVLFFLFPF